MEGYRAVLWAADKYGGGPDGDPGLGERLLAGRLDVVGERRQVDFTIDTRARWMEEEIEVKLRNRKEEPVEVLVREALYRWSNWKITSRTQEFSREDARTVVFPVRLAKDGEAVLRYRVRYSW